MKTVADNNNWLARHPIVAFLVLTFLISWSTVLFAASTIVIGKGEQVGMLALILFGQFGPSIAALYIVGKVYGRSGLGAYLRSGFSPIQPPGLIAIALFLSPAIFLAALGAAIALGETPNPLTPEFAENVAISFLTATGLGLLFGGVTEEFGWRGFLTPRLQHRFGFVIAAVVVGALWSIWHLEPEYVALWITDGWDAFWAKERDHLKLYLIESIPVSIIMAWLFNRSKGSIFLMILFHSSANASIAASRLIFEERSALWANLIDGAHWLLAIALILLAFRAPIEKLDAAEKRFSI